MVTTDISSGTPTLKLARRSHQDPRQSTLEATSTPGDAKERRRGILIRRMIGDALGGTGSSVIVVLDNVSLRNHAESVADLVLRIESTDARRVWSRGTSRNVRFVVERGSRDRPVAGVPITAQIIRLHSESVRLFGNSGPRSLGTEQMMRGRVSNIHAPATTVTAESSHEDTVLDYATPTSQVSEFTSHDEAASLLRSAGLGLVADRLNYLHEIAETGAHEPEVNIESLKTFAKFMLAHPTLDTDLIGVDDDGHIGAQWFLSSDAASNGSEDEVYKSRFWGNGRGMIAMIFLPDGMVRFAANSGPAIAGTDRLRKSDTTPLEKIPQELASFLPWVMTS